MRRTGDFRTKRSSSDWLLDSLRVPGVAGGLEGFGGISLDFPGGQFLGHDGTLTLLECQKSLKDEKKVNNSVGG